MIVNLIMINYDIPGVPWYVAIDNYKSENAGIEVTLFNRGLQVWKISSIDDRLLFDSLFPLSRGEGGSQYRIGENLGLSADTLLLSFYNKASNIDLTIRLKGLEDKKYTVRAPIPNQWYTQKFSLPPDITQDIINRAIANLPPPLVGTQIDINTEIQKVIDTAKQSGTTDVSQILPLPPTQPEKNKNLLIALIGIAAVVMLSLRKKTRK